MQEKIRACCGPMEKSIENGDMYLNPGPHIRLCHMVYPLSTCPFCGKPIVIFSGVKRYWRWKFKGESGIWQTTTWYLDDEGISTEGKPKRLDYTEPYTHWKNYEKIKIVEDFVDVEILR